MLALAPAYHFRRMIRTDILDQHGETTMKLTKYTIDHDREHPSDHMILVLDGVEKSEYVGQDVYLASEADAVINVQATRIALAQLEKSVL